jgi:hypothetical protein
MIIFFIPLITILINLILLEKYVKKFIIDPQFQNLIGLTKLNKI